MNTLRLLVFAVAALFAGVAHAAPVTWTIPPTAVTGGRTISGTFVFDTSLPAAQRLVSINVTETGPTPTSYTFTGGINADHYFGQPAASVTTERVIAIRLPAIPATSGGNYTVPVIYVQNCFSAPAGKCDNMSANQNATNVIITSVAAAAIPTMTEWAMVLFGLILAGGAALMIQRRRLAA